MAWQVVVPRPGGAAAQSEEPDFQPLIGAALMDPMVRSIVGDGPINLFCAGTEVHAALRTAGGEVPPAPPLEDALPPQRLPSVAGGWDENRVLAEIDQDGFAFATHPIDEPFFNRRVERRPRQQNLLDIVLVGGRVCVRKRFRGLRRGAVRWGGQPVPVRQWAIRGLWASLRLFLYSEAAALLRLRDLPFVPKLRHIDFSDHALYIDCVEGESLRHRAARSGAPVHDQDLAADGELCALPGRELDRREVALLDHIGAGDFRAEIAAMASEINRCGVAPLDIKLGNFVRGAATGRLYWLDFEISRLQSQPRWELDLAAQKEILEYLFQLERRAARAAQHAAACAAG
jgi:hypothetical protein